MPLVHLLERSIYAMPSLVSGNWAQVALGIFIFLAALLLTLRIRGPEAMKKHFLENVLIGVAAVVLGWLGLFMCSLVVTVYNDHHDVNGRWKAVVNEKNRLKDGLLERDRYIKSLEGSTPADVRKRIDALNQQIAQYKAAQSPNVRAFPVSHDNRPGTPKMEYVLTTGIIRAGVDLDVNCDFQIAEVQIQPLTASGGSAGTFDGRQLSPTKYRASMLSPSWSPSTPLWMTVFFVPPVNRMPNCSIAPE